MGASVGVEASAKPFGMGASVTATASIELGYESRRNGSTTAEETKERGLIIPPRSTGCLCSEHHELTPVRANGEALSTRSTLGFDDDTFAWITEAPAPPRLRAAPCLVGIGISQGQVHGADGTATSRTSP
ncbi:hypothetical protein [Kitasatospora sp. NPDC017646]|uniref:hypothetical protein n=1 Tax=Kitasatospora sp. NPDC017646 TaxID=3364024 RepID=UPI0037AF0C23